VFVGLHLVEGWLWFCGRVVEGGVVVVFLLWILCGGWGGLFVGSLFFCMVSSTGAREKRLGEERTLLVCCDGKSDAVKDTRKNKDPEPDRERKK